jgi:magnesium chelatase accessory protein
MTVAADIKRVRIGAVDWYAEMSGEGPDVLLVHGTAASSHSWRKVVPLLTDRFRVLNVDLPGHGQSVAHATSAMSLAGMTGALDGFLEQVEFKPAIVVGHSAGAVILARLCARSAYHPERLISFNGAFFPFSGAAGALFSPIAKLIALTPFLPNLLSTMATRQTVEKLLRDTGSDLSTEDVDAYFALFKKPSHVAAALDMMANWDLSGVEKDLAALKAKCILVAGAKDSTVPPDSANRAAGFCVKASVSILPGLGHLLHEERPALAAAIIRGDEPWPT